MSNFKRTIGLSTAISIVVGGVIGSGIFMKPALMASQLGSPLLLLSVWLVAGLITFLGALCYSELSTMFPETGGQYVFYKKMYGNAFSFVYGWASFSVTNTAGNASIAYVFSQYTNYFIELPRFPEAVELSVMFHIPFIGNIHPLENIGVKLLTIFLILFLSWINYRSVKSGGALQRVLTALKAISIVLLIGGILFSGKGNAQNIITSSSEMPQGWALLSAYMAAIAGAFWAYDGWSNVTFVGGEIQDPKRNIPLSLFSGLFFCIVIYGLINLAYVYVLPIDSLSVSKFVASDVATVAWGSIGGGIIALIVIVSTLGTTNANVLATSRVTFAIGEENKWFSWAGKIHPKNETPGNALMLNAMWSTLLILSGSFDMLTDMLIFVSWFFYGMSVLGVFILRKKMKDVERPYKVWGYPFVPLLFVLFVIFFLVSTVYGDIMDYQSGKTHIINSVLGIAITLIGIPIYYLSRKKNV